MFKQQQSLRCDPNDREALGKIIKSLDQANLPDEQKQSMIKQLSSSTATTTTPSVSSAAAPLQARGAWAQQGDVPVAAR